MFTSFYALEVVFCCVELPSVQFSSVCPVPTPRWEYVCVCFGTASHVTMVGVEQVIGSGSY